MADLTTIFHHLQRRLFPALEAELGTLSALDQQFCKVFSLTDLDRFARRYEWCGNGAPPCPRTWRRTLSLPSMSSSSPHRCAAGRAQVPPLLRQLCGWDSADEVPSEPTFSRAFAQFADDQLPQQTHEQMAKTHAGPKLVGHVSRDATAIKAPERPAAKPAPSAPAAPRKHGRPKQRRSASARAAQALGTPTARTLAENLDDLPARCDVGCKRNSKGHRESWIGDKLHLDRKSVV